ncbi:MAG: RIP metalloprotease RseP [Myxococcales bacterium]|nr:RIP metalloprotease RseP [Myxococcales bacterium]
MDILYFALLVSVLIFVHELGHFVWAKIFGVKVLMFSIGFGPKLVRLRGRETEYCIGLLPLGGFVKMLEENRQEPVLPEDRPRTFEAQKLWKRVIIVLAGPAMNILFPVLLYLGVFLGESDFTPPTIGIVLPGHAADGKLRPGDRVLEIDDVHISTFAELRRVVGKHPGKDLHFKVFRDNEHVDVHITPEERLIEKPFELVEREGSIGVMPNEPAAVVGVGEAASPAYRAGLRTFDRVTEVAGTPVETLADLEAVVAQNKGETVPVTYLRPVRVPDALGGLGEVSVYESGVAALTPEPTGADMRVRTGMESADLYVSEVEERSAEWNAGLRPGDRITALGDHELVTWSMLVEKLDAAPERAHTLHWLRDGARHSGTIELRRESWTDEFGNARVRFVMRTAHWLPTVQQPPAGGPSFWHYALPSAIDETVDVVQFIVVGISRIVQGKVSLSTLGGPIAVYDVVGQESAKGASYFLWAMAVISINLGLINLLPIPMLDGGHLLFFGIEAILRRPLPLRVREVASFFGMVLLAVLMALALKNDVEKRWDIILAQFKDLFG